MPCFHQSPLLHGLFTIIIIAIFACFLFIVGDQQQGPGPSAESSIHCWPDCRPHSAIPVGQPPHPGGIEQPRRPILNLIGGIYSQNTTLFFRNSPYRVDRELIVEYGATLTIETGVQIFFDTGVGIKVFGTLKALGNEFAHVQMLPYQEQMNYDRTFPEFRLIDGPSVRQGRLQARFRDRWRSVCTQLTNWTSVDTGAACRTMGYSDGGFWRFFLRNNDSYPLVMAQPGCSHGAANLWECDGFRDLNRIALSENLCQGEDDLGLYCWGPPIFTGWARHWKGIQIYNSPFVFVPSDPDEVALHRESLSRLEFVDILYAGYDGLSKNVTPAVYIEGVPPLMNGLRVEWSARDGIYLYEPEGPVIIANSTVWKNRGHGVVVDQAVDSRLFINQSRISENYGDGVWYRQMHQDLSLTESFYGLGIGSSNQHPRRFGFDREKPHFDMCQEHSLPRDKFFPYLISAHIQNGTSVDSLLSAVVCWTIVSLPPRLPYHYSIQFLSVRNRNPVADDSPTSFVICEGNMTFPSVCQSERFRFPVRDGILPQSVTLASNGNPLYVGLEHAIGRKSGPFVAGDVDVLFRIHASVTHKAIYGLNITNSEVSNNTGNGIQAQNIRDRLALCNVSVEANQGLAGLLVRGGASDIWINDTSLSWNWGDGMNVSYAGGSINLNSSRIVENRWRGFAFHHNASIPFYAFRHEIVIKGRPANNPFWPRMIVEGNLWGGVLVGNFCTPANSALRPRILVSWSEFLNNQYHPAMEIFSCQSADTAILDVDFSGNTVLHGTGMGFRMEPCVNAHVVLNSNRFHSIQNTALLIRNAKFPKLKGLLAQVTIAKNDIKMNTGQYIVSIGLNEDAPRQKLVFNQQNEVRSNKVVNPFPFLKPRSTPYAALVVSSSNVEIRHNCFGNPNADFEIGTELMEHAKRIDARENNWGDPNPQNFMNRIFDQFNRYSLASIDVDPFMAVCNQRSPSSTRLQQYFRQFRQPNQPFIIGGTIYENNDLPAGRYTVTDDLHIAPGAKLTLAPGTTLEFMNSVGMLVQGELLRNDYNGGGVLPITFTSRQLKRPPKLDAIRLVDEFGDDGVFAGRLEVRFDDDGQWGTVCNRSWTASLSQLVCNQFGLTLDPEHFENWRIFPSPGEHPIRMDNVRCEEREFDLARCRHDGQLHNVVASCRPTEVVGIRCLPSYWAGVRYSLLANPPSMAGQMSMNNWIIEKAGLYDFRTSSFGPALQIDWNYHNFEGLIIRDNFYDGLDVIYNDWTKKPTVRNSQFLRNRRNGVVVRSMGLTLQKFVAEGNELAGVRFNPRIAADLQRDIVSWLDRREQPELEANNVFALPDRRIARLQLFESQLNHRKFLVFREDIAEECTQARPCLFELELEAVGNQYGITPKLAVQLINRASNISDEDAWLIDRRTGKRWGVRQNTIEFPIQSSGSRLSLQYKRSIGTPSLVLLVLFLDAQEYLDNFVHVFEARIQDNQYGVSALHYNNLSLIDDGSILNRQSQEKLWFQRVNFTRNREAVVWAHSAEQEVLPGTPLAHIHWHIDNCSIYHNGGPIRATHRDLHLSANLFHWNFWSNTFWNNSALSGVFVQLPDTYDLLTAQTHSFLMTENRFEQNENFQIRLHGYYAFVNISSNNFTDNSASTSHGILEVSGMEKSLVMERNRFLGNWGHWMARLEATSHTLRFGARSALALVQYNYFQFNRFLPASADVEYTDSWPRSYALGIFGAQLAEVHFNRLRNVLLDFELVAGQKPQIPGLGEVLNATHNWWGVANEAGVHQRVFDMDDWNTFQLAQWSPFYTTEELSINFWWSPATGQLSYAKHIEPNVQDLKGRMYESKTLQLDAERWYPFPYHYKPFRPYRITKDLTIMPGATLTIEKNVEIHVWPNVRILVFGNLIADGTLWQPIRFKPINTTEFDESRGEIGTRFRRRKRTIASLNLREKLKFRGRNKRSDLNVRFVEFERAKERRMRRAVDEVFRKFPEVVRENSQYQKLSVLLMEKGEKKRNAGFLNFYNATSGEIVPSCDVFFTLRNAQTICRELGRPTPNAYHWLTPQWDYNPRIRILKTYMEPRECRGGEQRFDECPLRITAQLSDWQCSDNEHFNYVHCGSNASLAHAYIGNWGGITFASQSLEGVGVDEDRSVLRHVEIVGGGLGHNDSLQAGALQIIRRSPVVENVNVTNSSLHAIQVVNPTNNVMLTRLNISDNQGQGISVLTTNLKSGLGNSAAIPSGPLNIPYQSPGILDVCSAGKLVQLDSRILIYYKYDSVTLDCVKVFQSKSSKNLGFRLIQMNLFKGPTGVGRPDSLSIFAGDAFASGSLLRQFTPTTIVSGRDAVVPSQTFQIGLHLRATAADGEYGFTAEVSALPAAPIPSKSVDEIAVRLSRLLNNDRGALHYRNVGEIGPSLIVEQCSIERNGYFLYGNLSTSSQAVELHLHNTLLMLFRANALRNNRGGLLAVAKSSTAVSLSAIVKNNAFTKNSNSTTLSFIGSNNQRVHFLNNIVALNYALYADTALVAGMSANFSHNLFLENVGWHTIDTKQIPISLSGGITTANMQHFSDNYFEGNLALGHGNPYNEKYGYHVHDRNEFDEFIRRPKRQVLSQSGVSFDWWTHVGADTDRLRSTIFAGSPHQLFRHNVFNDPLNDYELTTANQTQFETATIDAQHNYWGYPGTKGVASGKIRDQADYPYLIRVDFVPALESNTSLIEGDCPAGWFQVGREEFKSCFLFVGASTTYANAVEFCQDLGAFMPVLRSNDPRQTELASRVDRFGQIYSTETERTNSFGIAFDIPIWITSVSIPSNQCGFMNSRTANVGEQNCNNLLPFVCERGLKAYQEPFLWYWENIVFVLIMGAGLLLLILCLIFFAFKKSQQREQSFRREQKLLRDSLRQSREWKQKQAQNEQNVYQMDSPKCYGLANGGGGKKKALNGLAKRSTGSSSASSGTAEANTWTTAGTGDYSSSSYTVSSKAADSLRTDDYAQPFFIDSTRKHLLSKELLRAKNIPSSAEAGSGELKTFRMACNNPNTTSSSCYYDASTASCSTTCSCCRSSCYTKTCSKCNSLTPTEESSSVVSAEAPSDDGQSTDSTLTGGGVTREGTLTRPLLKQTNPQNISRRQNGSHQLLEARGWGSRPEFNTNSMYQPEDWKPMNTSVYSKQSDLSSPWTRPSPLLNPSRSNPSIYNGKNLPAKPIVPIKTDFPRIPLNSTNSVQQFPPENNKFQQQQRRYSGGFLMEENDSQNMPKFQHFQTLFPAKSNERTAHPVSCSDDSKREEDPYMNFNGQNETHPYRSKRRPKQPPPSIPPSLAPKMGVGGILQYHHQKHQHHPTQSAMPKMRKLEIVPLETSM